MRSWAAAVVLVGALCVPGMSWADCSEDADCASGEVCVWAPCPAIDCAPGSSCPEPACPDTGTCEAVDSDVYWSGETCAEDADCPSGFTCEETMLACETYGCGCACAPCEPGTSCPPCECDCPEPPPCEEEIIKACAFKPQACSADSDCSDGFECQAQEVCYGSAGCGCTTDACVCPGCVPGGECPPCECPEPEPCECPEPAEETCETTGSFCVPKLQECDANSDCPADWECASLPDHGGTDCACAGCACTDGDPNCECEPCSCPEPSESPASVCMPEGWTELLDSGGTSNGGQDAPRGTSPAAEFAENASEETQGGSTGNTNNNDNSEEAGCSVNSTATPIPLRALPWALLTLGAGMFWARRRRRS